MDIIRRHKEMLIISLAIAFMFGIFGPVDYYFGNISDLWYDIYDILPIIFCVFLMIALLTTIVGFICSLNERIYKAYVVVLIILGICFYIQGSFLKVPYGALNGESIKWDSYAGYDLASTLVWIVVIAILLILVKKLGYKGFANIGKIVMICLMITMIITVLIFGFTKRGFAKKIGMKATTEYMGMYSQNRNFNILILDTYDARVFNDYIIHGGDEKVKEVFADFTYFEDTLGSYTLTNYALPHILTGFGYDGDVDYEEYIEKAYSGSPLLSKLKEKSWSIELYTNQNLPQLDNSYIDNIHLIDYKCSNRLEVGKSVYRLVGFKYAPTALKRYAYYPAEYLESLYEVGSIDGVDADTSNIEAYSWENYELIKNTQKIDKTDDDVFHMYHMKGIHALRDLDNNYNVITDPDSYYSLEQEGTVVVNLIGDWLEKLKENDVYDNSVILIMADHGASTYEAQDNFIQCPLLLVKGFDEKHGFCVSDMPISYEDIQLMCGLLLDGDDSITSGRIAIENIGIDVNRYNVMDITDKNDLCKITSSERNNTGCGRRRVLNYHRFAGNLGMGNRGDKGYTLYTDYPAYVGEAIQIQE